MKPILVGEDNPYGSDPDFALYPMPSGCSGHRLCCLILGMRRSCYLEVFDRANLCSGKWSMREARIAAESLRGTRTHLILCGSKVAKAFGVEFRAFESRELYGAKVLILPHPSGRNLLWNQAGIFDRARLVVGEFLPEIAPFLGIQEKETA